MKKGTSLKDMAIVLSVLSTMIPCQAAAPPAPSAPQSQEPGRASAKPAINILLLDDGARGLPDGMEERRNAWPVWEQRLPTFLPRLSLVANFRKASGDRVEDHTSLHALEISSAVPRDRREKTVTEELQQLQKVTRRPTAILARSSSGQDQLRVVLQDTRDYRPEDAARLVAFLADISPAIAHQLIAANFGPFQSPPTLIFDPRAIPEPSDSFLPRDSFWRWRVLEQTYLIPHFVLHMLSVLNESITSSNGTFYPNSTSIQGSTHYAAVEDKDTHHRLIGEIARKTGHSVTATFVEKRGNEYRINAGGRATQFLSPDTGARFSTLQEAAERVRKRDIASKKTSPYNERLNSFSGMSAGEIGQFMAKIGEGTLIGVGKAAPTAVEAAARSKTDRLNLFNPEDVTKQSLSPFINVQIGITPGGPADMSGASSLLDLGQVDRLNFGKGRYMPFTRTTGITVAPAGDVPVPAPQLSYTDQYVPDGSGLSRGGILFEKGNVYILDIAGRVSVETERAAAAVAASTNGHGATYRAEARLQTAVSIPLGKPRTGADLTTPSALLLLRMTAVQKSIGCLPVAFPQFFAVKPNGRYDATFDPARLRVGPRPGTGKGHIRNSRVTLIVSETGNRLRYGWPRDRGERATAQKDPMPGKALVKRQSDFQPDLCANSDGSFTWGLSHGVMVEFDETGLPQGLRGPNGETLRYRRQAGHVAEQLVSDDRRLCAGNAQPGLDTKWLAHSITYDDRLRVTEVLSGTASVRVEYLGRANTIRIISPEGQVDWRFQPNGRLAGVVMGDKAILWTRTSDGRIIQMASGSIVAGKRSAEFRPSAVVGALPCASVKADP